MDWFDAMIIALYATPITMAFVAFFNCQYERKYRKDHK